MNPLPHPLPARVALALAGLAVRRGRRNHIPLSHHP